MISGEGFRVRQNLSGMDDAGDSQTVLHLGVLDRVPSYEGYPRLLQLGKASPKDLFQDRKREGLDREGREIKSREWGSSHGVDIAQRVRGGDLPEGKGVIDNRSEKVDGLNQGKVVGQLIDPRVVRGLCPHQDFRVFGDREFLQNLVQILRTDLRGSARFLDVGRETNWIHLFSLLPFEGSVPGELGGSPRGSPPLFEFSLWASDVTLQEGYAVFSKNLGCSLF